MQSIILHVCDYVVNGIIAFSSLILCFFRQVRYYYNSRLMLETAPLTQFQQTEYHTGSIYSEASTVDCF